MEDRSHLDRRQRNALMIVFALYVTFIGGSTITDLRLSPRIAHHLIMTALLGWWLISRLRKGQELPSAGPLDAPLAAWLVAMALAAAFAVFPRLSLEAIWRGLVHTLFFYLILDLMRRHGARAVVEPLFFAAGVVILIGMLEFASWYFGLPMLPSFAQGWLPIGGLRHPIPPRIYRLAFTFSSPTALSAYLAMLTPFGLGWALTVRTAENRRALWLWLLGAVVTQGLSFSRGGLLSLAVSLPLFGLLTWKEALREVLRDRRTWIVLGAVAILLAVVGIGWARHNLAGHITGDVVRLDLWRSALAMARTDPLTGVGPDGYGRVLREVRNPLLGDDRIFTANSRPLMVLAEMGIPGLSALIWGVAAMAWVAIRRLRGSAGIEHVRTAGAVAGMAGFAAHSVIDDFYSLPVLVPLMVMAACVLGPDAPISGQRWRRWAAAAALSLLAVGLAGWAISDLAQYHYTRSLQMEGDEALAEIDRACRIDPAMDLYALQRAQYLGEMALSDSTRLEDALAAYAEAIPLEETSDIAHANYAYLLLQSSDLESAREHMLRALAIRPRNLNYVLWAGVLAERSGKRDEAIDDYAQVLASRPAWAASEFWEEQEVTLFDEALAEALSLAGPTQQSLLLFYTGDVEGGIATAAQAAEEEDTDAAWLTLGELYLHSGSPAEAEAALAEALQRNDGLTDAYALRAEARLSLGDAAGAEQDARTANFLSSLDPGLGTAGWVVLARLAEADGDREAACANYARGVPGIILWQNWEMAVFRRAGRFYALFDVPGPTRYDVAAWQRLVDVCPEWITEE
jgi:tetratricopeptide (TPR) repeat protein/O-antigen ligase